MQIRRVLLLFALVLGLSAVVASVAPPPEEEDEGAATVSTLEEDAPPLRRQAVTLRVRDPGARPMTRHVEAGSSFSLEVSVPAPGDVVIERLGLRKTAVPLVPAEFDLLAHPPGRYDVDFAPVDGDRRLIGRLVFGVTPRSRGHRRSAR